MRRLKSELHELEHHLQLTTGYVTNGTQQTGNTIALLMQPDAEDSGSYVVAAYKVLQNEGENFAFHLEHEDSILVAFIDVNQDFRHDEGEPIAVLPGKPRASAFTFDQSRWTANRLHISERQGVTPELAIDLSGGDLTAMPSFTGHIGQVTDFDDPNFASERVFLGLWEPLRFAREVGYGF